MQMHNLEAFDVYSGFHAYATDAYEQVTMTTGSTVLSRVTLNDTSDLTFTWVNLSSPNQLRATSKVGRCFRRGRG
jgi:hypothetical protein